MEGPTAYCIHIVSKEGLREQAKCSKVRVSVDCLSESDEQKNEQKPKASD